MIFMCLYVWVLHWLNYLMSGFMVCANDDYLRIIYGGKSMGFELYHVMVGKSNFSIAIGFIWS